MPPQEDLMAKYEAPHELSDEELKDLSMVSDSLGAGGDGSGKGKARRRAAGGAGARPGRSLRRI